MTKIEELHKSCELGLLEKVKDLVVNQKIDPNQDMEGSSHRYPTTIYVYCSTIELLDFFNSLGYVPNYNDIVKIYKTELKEEIFDWLIHQFDFGAMEKDNDYEDEYEEACEKFPKNPILFLALKYALEYRNISFIKKYAQEFRSIDWHQKFTDRWDGEYTIFKEIPRFFITRGEYEKKEQKKSVQFLTTLIDEYDLYDFSIIEDILLYRETELLEKYIKKDAEQFLSQKGLLEKMVKFTNGEEYRYKDISNNPELYTFNYKQDERDKILALLLENGYNFIVQETQIFQELLTGTITLLFPRYNYGKKLGDYGVSMSIDKKPFWQMLEDIPNTHNVTFFDICFSQEEIEKLDTLGYLGDKSEILYELIDNFKQDGYAYNTYEEIAKDSNEYKALQLINEGVSLSLEKQKDLLFEYKAYDMIPVNEKYSRNYTMINKFIIEKLANKQTATTLFETIVNKKMDRYALEDFFKNYGELKRPLLDFVKEDFLANDSTKELYAKYYLRTEEEIYEYLQEKKEYYTIPQKSYGGKTALIYLGEYGQMGKALLESRNFEGFRGAIRFMNENNLPFKDTSVRVDMEIIKEILVHNPPKDVLEYMLSTVTEYSFSYKKPDQKFLDQLIKYELWDVGKKLTENKELNILDKYRKTPLHYACEEHNLTAIKNYIKLGLSLTQEDRYGKNPIDSYLKTKPSPKDQRLLDFFEWLLQEFVQAGGMIVPLQLSKAIKANKFKPYHDIIEKIKNEKALILEEQHQENNQDDEEDDEELVEVTVYKTERSTHYHKYSATVMIAKKDLVLDESDLINDYVQDWEYDSQWDNEEETNYEIISKEQ